MNMWLMYLVLKLDGLLNVFHNLAGVVGFIFVMLSISLAVSYIPTSVFRSDEEGCALYLDKVFPKLVKVAKILGAVWAMSLLIATLCPTTKQAAAIYLVPKVINNKQIQKMPNKLVTLANDWMDEQIKLVKIK